MREPFFKNSKGKLCWSCVHEGCAERWIWAEQSVSERYEHDCKTKYEEHIKTAHSGVYYQCHLCSQDIQATSSKPDTLKHNPSKLAYTLHLLKSHMIRTEGYDGYICAFEEDGGVVCQYRTVKKLPFLRHLTSLHLTQYQEVYTCEICGVSYKLKSGLDRHRKSEHEGVDRQRFFCPRCVLNLFIKKEKACGYIINRKKITNSPDPSHLTINCICQEIICC